MAEDKIKKRALDLDDINLTDLGDVVAPSPALNELIYWNGANWVNGVPSGLGGIAGNGIEISAAFAKDGVSLPSMLLDDNFDWRDRHIFVCISGSIFNPTIVPGQSFDESNKVSIGANNPSDLAPYAYPDNVWGYGMASGYNTPSWMGWFYSGPGVSNPLESNHSLPLSGGGSMDITGIALGTPDMGGY